MLAMMDPDDAAALIDELDYEKAEKLLRPVGVKEEKAIRTLLGYEDDTAGRIMTSEFVALPERPPWPMPSMPLSAWMKTSRASTTCTPPMPTAFFPAVLSMRALVIAESDELLRDLAYRDVVYVEPDRDRRK